MTEFASDQISGPNWIENTTDHGFAVYLPDGRVGLAVVGTQEAASATHESVADALNFQVQRHGREAVVEALTRPGGLRVTPQRTG